MDHFIRVDTHCAHRGHHGQTGFVDAALRIRVQALLAARTQIPSQVFTACWVAEGSLSRRSCVFNMVSLRGPGIFGTKARPLSEPGVEEACAPPPHPTLASAALQCCAANLFKRGHNKVKTVGRAMTIYVIRAKSQLNGTDILSQIMTPVWS